MVDCQPASVYSVDWFKNLARYTIPTLIVLKWCNRCSYIVPVCHAYHHIYSIARIIWGGGGVVLMGPKFGGSE